VKAAVFLFLAERMRLSLSPHPQNSVITLVRGIKVMKKKFLEKRLCVSHLPQDHAIWLLFPDQMFFFPAALIRLFLPGARFGRLAELATSRMERYRSLQVANQSRRRADSERYQSISAIS